MNRYSANLSNSSDKPAFISSYGNKGNKYYVNTKKHSMASTTVETGIAATGLGLSPEMRLNEMQSESSNNFTVHSN